MLRENEVLANTFQIMKQIGEGGSGHVYLAYHLNLKKYVVVKQVYNGILDEARLRKEADILKDLHHSNLPQVYDYIQGRDAAYTVIDYVNGYDLDAYINSHTYVGEEQMKKWLRQVADALAYLHSRKTPIIHSDIKPANIIINQDGDAILIDFNVSLDNAAAGVIGVSYPYASPEQLMVAQSGGWVDGQFMQVDGRTDIYSLGVTFYQLMTGILPNPNVNLTPTMSMNLQGYSDGFRMLIDRMIQRSREKRPQSAKQVLRAIDGLFRQNGKYWLYFLLRTASSLLCAVVFSLGLYLWITGTAAQNVDDKHDRLNALLTSVNSMEADTFLREALDLEHDRAMADYFSDYPLERAQLYHAMGEVAYNEGDFWSAIRYYTQAVDLCAKGDDDDLRGCYLRDEALAYAEAGDTAKAMSLLDSAIAAGAEESDLLLLQAEIAHMQGDVALCREYVGRILQISTDRTLCRRACVTAAASCANAREEIYWLELAEGYDPVKTVHRGLAAAYIKLWQTTPDEREKQEALDKAIAQYEPLAMSKYATVEDSLNYAVVLRIAERSAEAVPILLDRLQYSEDDYRVLMNLAFAYYETGDDDHAMDYCRRAYEAWNQSSSASKEDRYSENIQNLLQLMERYSIMG